MTGSDIFTDLVQPQAVVDTLEEEVGAVEEFLLPLF